MTERAHVSGENRAGRPSSRPDPRKARGQGAARPDRTARTGGSSRPGRPAVSKGRPSRVPDKAESAPVAVYPSVLPEVAADQLDRMARRELSGLSKEDADFVAKHLVMASLVVGDDPALAHQHALAALAKGPRVPVVRETLGITSYLTGDFALCLRELRTHRRLSGQNTQLPMMVDAERGLGRPERGIELARGVSREGMPDQWAVELAIALSGCRLDLGQLDQALDELHIPQLDPTTAFSYSPDLFDAYAVVLEDLGRADEAALWSKRADVARKALDDRNVDDYGEVGDVFDTLDDSLVDDVAEVDVDASAMPEDTSVTDRE